jgi:hypothetical protein
LRPLLQRANLRLRHELGLIERELNRAGEELPQELSPYHAWCIQECQNLVVEIEKNFATLSAPKLKDDTQVLVIVLSQTQEVRRRFNLLDERYVPPILTPQLSDRLCLKVLSWLYQTHTSLTGSSFAMGGFSFAATKTKSYPGPCVYFVPSSARFGLLYLPLLFHEFGHTLYAYYEDELQNLIKEVQLYIQNYLKPKVVLRDGLNEQQTKDRKQIVEIWFEWMQELFCDAVGLAIGGPAFAYAFSTYMLMHGDRQFRLPLESLSKGRHPVTWIRIRVMIEQLKTRGFDEPARQLHDEWEQTAKMLNINEDYYGYFDCDFIPEILRVLQDMLEEASPALFEEPIGIVPRQNTNYASPVHLIDAAWHRHLSDSDNYSVWEREAIASYLSTS